MTSSQSANDSASSAGPTLATPPGILLEMAASLPKICSFCSKLARYTCPRCNCEYCSVDCYRHANHSHCSEEFYKGWVYDTLSQGKKSSTSEKKDILDMIKRVNDADEDSLDSDDETEGLESLEKRVQGLDLDNADCNAILERLTNEEKTEFVNLLRNGEAEKLVPIWVPWWCHKEETCLVVEMDKEPIVPAYKINSPVVPETVLDLSKLLKNTRPSPLLKFNIVNALYAYAYLAKLHNGDHHAFPIDSAHGMMCLSDVLANRRNFNNVGEAIYFAIHQLEENAWLQSSQIFSQQIIGEVKAIIEGPCSRDTAYYTLAALADIKNIFFESRKCSRQRDVGGYTSRSKEDMLQLRKLYKTVEKKLDFLMSWVNENSAILPSLVASLEVLRFEEATVEFMQKK